MIKDRKKLNRSLNSGKRLMRRRRKLPKDKVTTYTKMLVSSLTVLAALWISWSYILATTALLMYGNVDPLSTVSEEVCRTVIATVIGYCVKSLFENISKYTVADQKNSFPQEDICDDEYSYSNGAEG